MSYRDVGTGRYPVEIMVKTTRAQARELDAIAKLLHVPRNAVVRMAIEGGIAELSAWARSKPKPKKVSAKKARRRR